MKKSNPVALLKVDSGNCQLFLLSHETLNFALQNGISIHWTTIGSHSHLVEKFQTQSQFPFSFFNCKKFVKCSVLFFQKCIFNEIKFETAMKDSVWVWDFSMRGPIYRNMHFGMRTILGLVLVTSLVFTVTVLGVSRKWFRIASELWVQKKLVKLWQCTQWPILGSSDLFGYLLVTLPSTKMSIN